MKNTVSFCPICGRKTVEYQQTINKTLISALARLNAVGGKSRLDKMNLTNSQFTNFQKLKYFNLAVPSNSNNEWQITNEGLWFLQGRIQIPKSVTTKNGTVIRKSNELVYINQVKDCAPYKLEWQEQACQPSLFD